MKIKNRNIGLKYKPFIVAELSGNHSGSLKKALKLIKAAKKAGADHLINYAKGDLREQINTFTGKNSKKIWEADDLCTSRDTLFIASGVCDGWLPGVQFNADNAKTWSRIIYGETGEAENIETIHKFNLKEK